MPGTIKGKLRYLSPEQVRGRTLDSRTDILQTGISVVQFPAGIEWEDGELAYLVIGIAATADEHIGVLANLSQVIEEEADAQQLIHADDPMLIVERLGRPAVVEEE